MSGHSFRELLSEVVEGRAHIPHANPEYLKQLPEEDDISLKQSLVHPDFIRFFLSFLREASSCVVEGPDVESSALFNLEIARSANRTVYNAPTDEPTTGCSVRMMSTPKVKDDIVNPKSYHNASASSLRTPVNSKVPGKSPSLPEPRKHNGRSSAKPRREPLSLSDFLSPEAGHSSKKRTQKRGKRVQLTPVSEIRAQRLINGGSYSHHDLSHSPRLESISSVKYPENLQVSEANRSISFAIEEEFPALSSVPPQTVSIKSLRRIKPTTVKPVSAIKPDAIDMPGITEEGKLDENVPNDLSNPFNSAPSVAPSSGKDLTEERGLLLRMKTQAKNLDFGAEEKNVRTSVKSLEEISPVKKCNVGLDPHFIIDRMKVDRIAGLYSYFINCCLVPNIIAEIQFITDLLTVMLSTHKSESSATGLSISRSLCNSSAGTVDTSHRSSFDSDLLSTAANCVYFSVIVIQSLVSSGILSILSRSTLSLLAQSQRIQIFLPGLPGQILILAEKLESKEKETPAERCSSEEKLHLMSSVMFEAETDDRSNFSSDKAFHAFRKHRDLFYSIVREYDERKHVPNFEIQQHLATKIKNLVSQVKGSATYKPFVRLFVSQMLQEAGRGGKMTPTADAGFLGENTNIPGRVDLLALLRQGDPEKFRRLQSRFFTSSNSQQMCKTKDILFDQCYFYKEFVLCADSCAVNTYLCNELRARISDIESQQVQQILDDALAETVNAASVSTALSSLISSARVIGRFLGFISFEPYHADGSATCIYDSSALSFVSDALDVARSGKHELSTIPWVTEYLKSAKFSLSSMTSEVEMLAEKLFAAFSRHSFDGGKMLRAGDLLICLMVTTLLDMQVFPDDFFYHLLNKYPGSDYLPKNVYLGTTKAKNTKEEMEDPSFENCCSELVSFSLIYEVNPTLREIRSSIISCNSGTSKPNHSQQPSRKIKPNTEKDQEDTNVQKKEKQLQHTLEEHFFRGQPSSLKRTVMFIAERCASNCVKRIRSISMLEICDEAEKLLISRIHRAQGNHETYAKGMLTREITAEMKTLAKDRMLKECDEFCERAVPQCLQNLSSCETADGVLKLATTMARKNAVASVHLWLSTRLDELVSVSVKARLTKVHANILDSGDPVATPVSRSVEDGCETFKELDSFSSLLQTMKECIMKLTFETASDTSLVAPTICPTLVKKLSEHDVSYLLRIANLVLEERSENLQGESIRAMRRLLSSSPHLKSTLVLTCRELRSRANIFFS